MVEIYFGLTDKHIKNYEIIIQNIKSENKDIERILITDNDHHNPNLWTEIIKSKHRFLEKGTNLMHDFKFMIKKIKAYKTIINQINRYKAESEIRIYLAYIEDILSNYLFFSFHNNAEVIIVEDGILNYYDHSFRNISKTRFYIKKALSQVFGITFKKYKGHSSGIEYKKSEKQYLSFPKLATFPQKTCKIPVLTHNFEVSKKKLYIIGQENLIQILGFKVYKSVFCEFLEELKQNLSKTEVNMIYYKPRHQCLEFEKTNLEKTFEKMNLKILNNNSLAEEDYFKSVQSAYIASMISSALLTIYAQCGEEVKSNLKIIFKPVMGTEISQLFEKLNFTKLGQ